MMAGTRERYRLALCEQAVLRLGAGRDRNRVLQVLLEAACKDLGAGAGSIILTGGGKKGKFVAVVSRRPQSLKRMVLSLDRGVVGWCVRNKRMAWVPNVERDRRYDPKISEKIKFPTRNILCAPVKPGKTVVGAVELINLKDNKPSKAKMDQFRTLVTLVGRVVGAAKK